MTSTPTTYVVMIGDHATSAATTLGAAQADGIAAEILYGDPYRPDLRWDAYRPDEWRLMARRRDETGAGRGRWAWTRRAIHAVPTVDGSAS